MAGVYCWMREKEEKEKEPNIKISFRIVAIMMELGNMMFILILDQLTSQGLSLFITRIFKSILHL